VLNPVENKAVWPKNDLPLYDLTAELHRVIRENAEDETDYKRYVASMKQSVLTAFYTPKEIPEAIWSVFGEMNLSRRRCWSRLRVWVSLSTPCAPSIPMPR
jgi:hypothetical protein